MASDDDASPEEVLRTPKFVVERRRVDRGGQEFDRYIVVHPGAAVILPFLPDGRVVLVENQRVSVGRPLLELPAGTLEPPEPPIACAARELEEETGYRAGTVRPLVEFLATPGICTERMHAFVAEDLVPGPSASTPARTAARSSSSGPSSSTASGTAASRTERRSRPSSTTKSIGDVRFDFPRQFRILGAAVDILDQLWAHADILSIPFVSAFVGWFTNVVAVQMMFYPTEFVGIRPFLGWQGIVPMNAKRLAQFSIRLITTKLVSLKELFDGFSGEDFAKNLDGVVEEVTEQVIQEIAEKHAPALWANAGEFMQAQVREKVRDEVRAVAIRIADDLGSNITEILDLEQVVVNAVMADRALMSQMFLEVGREEFKFIERSGIWFGGLFGIVQMAIWAYFPIWWILPFFGFLVGYATNWLALKLVFEPKEPRRYGPFVVHGLFHKRQQEVASRFASMTSARILNADNMTATITTGKSAERVHQIIGTRIGELVDKYAAHPMAAMVMPEPAKVGTLRDELIGRVIDEIPKPGGLLHVFTGRAVDIRKSLEERMQKLDAESFEGVLRPAFQQDEWKLILAGAVLGLAAGFAQLVYVFAEQVPW